jgi:hypothetical protein
MLCGLIFLRRQLTTAMFACNRLHRRARKRLSRRGSARRSQKQLQRQVRY